MQVNIELLKELRNATGVSLADCRKALEQSSNDYDKALEWLRKHGAEKAEKKSERETSQGLVEAYIHQNGRVGSIIELTCETDFVARTDEFKHLAHELAMQVSAMAPKDVPTLLAQEYIRDSSKTVEDFIKETITKLGENIVVKKLQRFEVGEH